MKLEEVEEKENSSIQKEEENDEEKRDGHTDNLLLRPIGVSNRHDDKLLDNIHGNGQSCRPQRSLW